MHRTLRPTLCATVVLLALALSLACTGDNDAPAAEPTEYDGNIALRTAVGAVPDRTYTIYWLGEGAPVADSRLAGPFFADTSDENSTTVFSYSYGVAETNVPVGVTVFAPKSWAAAEPTMTANLTGLSRSINVGGTAAELFIMGDDEVPPNPHLRALVRYPDAVVVVSTQALFDADNQDINPLTDPEVFIALLEENLRPYPD